MPNVEHVHGWWFCAHAAARNGARVRRPCPPAALRRSVGTDATPDAVVASRCVRPLVKPMRCSSSRVTADEFRRWRASAIDWLTRRWRHGALHDKPIAVIGRSTGCYSGVWSRQVEDAHGRLGPRAIEPLTVPTLREGVEEARRRSAPRRRWCKPVKALDSDFRRTDECPIESIVRTDRSSVWWVLR